MGFRWRWNSLHVGQETNNEKEINLLGFDWTNELEVLETKGYLEATISSSERIIGFAH